MNNNGILLSLAAHAGELIYELAYKHEDGVFLSEILKENPHFHRNIRNILNGYCSLLNELGVIFSEYELLKDAEKMVKEWILKLHKYRYKETKLLLDSITIDIGGDH